MKIDQVIDLKCSEEGYEKFINDCDLAIREGRIQDVTEAISQINTAKIPRKQRQPIARICRRIGAVAFGLRVISRIVRPKGAGPKVPASPIEIAEYAALLQMYGSVREALTLLNSLNPENNPEVHVFRAFCHFNLWEYREAVPHLEKYTGMAISPYQLRVGRLNLAAALVGSGRSEEALGIVESEIETNTREGHFRLAGNCHELHAQILINTKKYSEAKKALELAAERLGVSRAFDLTFVRKWSAVIDARESNSVEKLKEFRAHALKRQEWESVRDADRQLLRLNFDQAVFEKLVFGTPFNGYVRSIMEESGGQIRSDTYAWGAKTGNCLDMINGTYNGRPCLEIGSKVHQVLEVLSRDFYRPLTIGALFGALFPGEYFDIFSSPNRIHQCVFRARDWLQKEGVDIEIEGFDGNYRLVVGEETSIIVKFERKLATAFDHYFARLKEVFGNRNRFAATEGAKALGLSRSSFQRFASEAVERGYLQMHGVTKSARYGFVHEAENQNARVELKQVA